MRHQALRTVKEAGLMPPGPIRMWLKGEWQEIFSMDFEIYEEPVDKGYPEKVEDWQVEGAEALRNNAPDEMALQNERQIELAQVVWIWW